MVKKSLIHQYFIVHKEKRLEFRNKKIFTASLPVDLRQTRRFFQVNEVNYNCRLVASPEASQPIRSTSERGDCLRRLSHIESSGLKKSP